MPRGKGYLSNFMVRGSAIFGSSFFKPLRSHGYHFHNLQAFHGIMGVLFRRFFIISGIFDPDFHSTCGIMTQKSTRTYVIMGANFRGKMVRLHQMIGLDIPP